MFVSPKFLINCSLPAKHSKPALLQTSIKQAWTLNRKRGTYTISRVCTTWYYGIFQFCSNFCFIIFFAGKNNQKRLSPGFLRKCVKQCWGEKMATEKKINGSSCSTTQRINILLRQSMALWPWVDATTSLILCYLGALTNRSYGLLR